uniref:NR LBD domain-containing protein n=1 Tax=Caenorhabditis tropicalis TaxID=1561998 RepID=A0A1I7UE20_9PELO
MQIAEYYGMHNVIRYCELSFIRDFETAINKNQCIEVIFTLSIMSNLRRMMATVLRNIETRDELMGMVKKVDVDRMSGELMKMIVTWVFYDD